MPVRENGENSETPEPVNRKRLLWFILFWCAGVLCLAGITGLLRLVLNFLYST